MDQLLKLADELGLSVVERKGDKIGGYHAGSRTVRLNPKLPRRVARCVLAHEIAHHIFGDQPTRFGPVRAKQERRADEWTALYLIEPSAYARAEEIRGGHVPSMAYDLDVTVDIVHAFQGLLRRYGDAIYLAPKMGEGQWRHREFA